MNAYNLYSVEVSKNHYTRYVIVSGKKHNVRSFPKGVYQPNDQDQQIMLLDTNKIMRNVGQGLVEIDNDCFDYYIDT